MFSSLDLTLLILIIAGAVVTLVNRLAGHYIMARFEPIHYRVEAALEAVPVAVMITLVVPTVVDGGWLEWGTLFVTFVLGLRLPFIVAVFAALAFLLAMRGFGF